MHSPKKFLRLPVVLEKLGVSRAGLYARLNPKSSSFDPSFPKPARLSPGPNGTVAWLESEVETWMTARLEAR